MNEPKPWYKEFWPWFIIGLLGSVVLASLVTVVIAFRYADEPISGNYRKQGLAIMETKEPQEDAAQQSGGERLSPEAR